MNSKILIVDDEEIALFLHNWVIKESGLPGTVHSFNNGRKALDFLNQHQDDLENCIIFLDINMPVMNGWQLLTALEETNYKHRLNILMVTSSINAEDIRRAKNYSFVSQYVAKPLSLEVCRQLKKTGNQPEP